jgi:exopolyphosphatase/guanosine-5'-triphosphate,3'-diphosphate pyrophosphatase
MVPVAPTDPTAHDPIGAIDIGTNSAHLVVAQMTEPGAIRILEREKTSLRLGRALDAKGRIDADGIKRTVSALSKMQQICESYNARIRCVATHATREAANTEELIKVVRHSTGLKIEVIDGVEEARLIFLGMRHGLNLNNVMCLGVDIGGGSTEVILAKDEAISYIGSFKLGVITLTDKFLKSKEERIDQIAALKQYIRTRIAPLPRHVLAIQFDKAIASSGTAKSLALIHSRLFGDGQVSDSNGYEIPATELRLIVDRLIDLKTPEDISRELGIDSSRSELITAGAIILDEFSIKFSLKAWTVSTSGLREGVVADTFRRYSLPEDQSLPDVQWLNIKNFGNRLGLIGSHHENVMRLAGELFDGLAPDSFPDTKLNSFRNILCCAAYLHEAGKFVSEPGYHKHSQYLISRTRIPGFTQRERQLMGYIVRYHRKAIPKDSQDATDLTAKGFQQMVFMSGILRLATTLDRTRKGKITKVMVTRNKKKAEISLVVAPASNITVELDKAKLEQDRISKSIGIEISFSVLESG